MNKRLYFIGLVLIGLSLAYGLYYYDQLPEQMAVHLSFDNTPDRFQGKLSTIWGLPLFFAALQTLVFFSAQRSAECSLTWGRRFPSGVGSCCLLASCLSP